VSARPFAFSLALLLAAPALGHDAGQTVTFGRVSGTSFSVQARSARAESAQGADAPVVYDSGVSDPIAEAWDTVLIQGESPDAAIGFQAAREDGRVWENLEIHRFSGGRFWAKARLARAAGPLRLRALDAGAAADHDVTLYGVEVFIDEPVGAGAPAVPPRGPQNPDASRPLVHARADWKAVSPTQPWSPDPLPWRVTLHHSDGKHTTTLAQSEAEARFIQDFHIHGRGWIDIAYHFLVDAQGNILEGRPEGVLGAHTLANNEGNVGIVLLGTYHPPVNDVPTKAQLDAVTALGRYLVSRYGIDPKSLRGHRDYKQTDCPGNIAYAKLDALRLAFAGVPMPPAFVSKPARKPSAPLAWLDQPAFDGVAR
jgi:hypothetical protein